jgi:hypothetical protein
MKWKTLGRTAHTRSCPAFPVCAPCVWRGSFTASLRTAFSRRTRPDWFEKATTSTLVLISARRSRPSYASRRFALSSLWPPFAIATSFSLILPQPIYMRLSRRSSTWRSRRGIRRVWRPKKGRYGLLQTSRTRNAELDSRMGSEGLAAMPKNPAVYMKNTWDWEDFVAGGFWVDDFAGIGVGKELEALANGITSLGEVK